MVVREIGFEDVNQPSPVSLVTEDKLIVFQEQALLVIIRCVDIVGN
jgi:hypothetical protein